MPVDQPKSEETINGDRRCDRRYQIQLELRWKLIRRRKVLFSGEGRTVDLSSGGLLFDAGRPLPAGLNVEISAAWPVLLREQTPMQLSISGRIVRSHGNLTAIRMVQHEFRTAGSGIDRNRNTPAPAFLVNKGNAGIHSLH
jgi:hypothetical protein